MTRTMVSLIAVTLACASPASATGAAADQANIAAVRAVGQQWRALYAAGRFADIPELYTADTVVMPRGRARIEGREQMRKSIGGLAAGRKIDIETREREIKLMGNYAWYVGDFTVTYTSPGGAPSATEEGRSIIIYRRDSDGRWRIHRDIDSPAPHPAPVKIAAPAAGGGPVPALWDPATRQAPVACDRLASSRYDRTRLAPPAARADIDVPAAIVACEADLARLPGDPRLHFHLGRLYGYAGDKEKTLFHRRAAAQAGNHNAIFLLGYLDWAAARDDTARCAAAQRMKLAADRGNYSAQLTYASYFIEGRFAPCADAAGKAEVAAYLAKARPAVDGFFETRLADHLATGLDDMKVTP